MIYIDKYKSWLNSELIDEKTKAELLSIENDEREIEDRFYKDLEFGTAGLRGIIGAGTNRMNIYTVGYTTQGLANYITKWGEKGRGKGVAIAYDSRNMSREFADHVASILCGNGIKAYVFPQITPVPILSYAIRELNCISGIMITASHNPPEYNGYKVYWKEGYQLTPSIAKDITQEIEKISNLEQINSMNEENALEKGLLHYIDDTINKKYTQAILSQCIHGDMISKDNDKISIIFSPLFGSGYKPVMEALAQAGFSKVYIVDEQAQPDGNFPNVNVPNPEDPEVFERARILADKIDGDIILATDPDADRIGVAYKDNNGEYVNLTGNQIGCILEYYLLTQLEFLGGIPDNGIILKSIVTTDLADKIAKDYNISIENTLTGFKYIGEKIEEYKNTKLKSFLMGFEESYGYLVGSHARDKDAVGTALLLCEMALFYKLDNKTLGDVLEEIYQKYGYYIEDIESIRIEGKEGLTKLQRISDDFRRNLPMKWIDKKVLYVEDYHLGKKTIVGERVEEITLPKSNVLKIYLEDESWFCIRPSGTEPKIKIYFSIKGSSIEDAKEYLGKIKNEVMKKVMEAQNPTP